MGGPQQPTAFRAGGGFVGLGRPSGIGGGGKQLVLNHKKRGQALGAGGSTMSKKRRGQMRKKRIPYYLRKSKNEKRVSGGGVFLSWLVCGVEDNPEAVEQADGCLASGCHQDTEPRQALLLSEEKA
jgi:hypothetical protein